MPSQEEKLIKSLESLTGAFHDFSERSLMVRSWKNLSIFFLRGVMYGLGILFAIAIVIPIIIWLFHWIEWVPLIGDFVTQIIKRIEEVSQINGF
ncbi:hypothetical protein KKC44_06060 [Patescibacteria group bacterium]|nr:hypothetical protein [Patescibacteria group bacterium]MBU2260137.1 hypothetical protein [Patescibacteria group bacterium]